MSTVTDDTPAKPKEKAGGTEYVLLLQAGKHDGGSEQWIKAGTATALSADAAIRAHIANPYIPGAEPAGTYIAIPARSWKPRTLKVETRQIVRLD